jgi:prophage maintenance system killer protein
MTSGEISKIMQVVSKGKIVIYQAKGGETKLEVNLREETVWLNLNQMADLFQRDKSVISKHILNVFEEGELKRHATVAKFATVQKEGGRAVERTIEYYNLDVIISVGFRVKCQRGTQFRIWATRILKDHLLKGYTINEKRLKEQNDKFLELQSTINLLGRVIRGKELERGEAEGLLHVITNYSYALSLLDQYDHSELQIRRTTKKKHFIITYHDARKAINRLAEQNLRKGQPLGLFGKEKDKSFRSSLGAIHQTFGGKELYPSIEEKAAHLLYFVVKNHSFVDGNKRIGAFLFVWFLDRSGILYAPNGGKRIGDNALVALTLMIAESRPKDKDIIIKVIVNLINKDNLA